jgi:hypothetical protein
MWFNALGENQCWVVLCFYEDPSGSGSKKWNRTVPALVLVPHIRESGSGSGSCPKKIPVPVLKIRPGSR